MLSEIENLTFEYNDYIYSVLNYYCKACEQNCYDNVLDLFSHLPQLNVIKEILVKGMFNKKEIVIMKIVLDLYELFVRKFWCFDSDDRNMRLYIETAKLFYWKSLKEKDVMYIYEIIAKEMKRTFELLKKMGCCVYKRKNSYVKHITELKWQYIGIVNGLDKGSFIL